MSVYSVGPLETAASKYEPARAKAAIAYVAAHFCEVRNILEAKGQQSCPDELHRAVAEIRGLMRQIMQQDPIRCEPPFTDDINSIFTFSYLLTTVEGYTPQKRLWTARVRRDLQAQSLAIKIGEPAIPPAPAAPSRPAPLSVPTPIPAPVPAQPPVGFEGFTISDQILETLKPKLEELVKLLANDVRYVPHSAVQMLEVDKEVANTFRPICQLLIRLVQEEPVNYFFHLTIPINIADKKLPNLTWISQYLYLILFSLCLMKNKNAHHANWVQHVRELLQRKHNIKCDTLSASELLQRLTF
jgi:hypothetical protein